jgi:hypothetical protein
VEDEGAACATGQKGNWTCDVGILHRSVLWNALGNEMRVPTLDLTYSRATSLAHYTLHPTKLKTLRCCTVQQLRRQNPRTCTPGWPRTKTITQPSLQLASHKQLPATRLHYTYTFHNAKLPGPGFEEKEMLRERTMHVCSPIRKARR